MIPVVQQKHIPKGIFLIISLFLMLGGARLEWAIHTAFTLFPFESDAPVPFKYEGGSVFENLLSALSGLILLMAAYGLYAKASWSRPLALTVSGFYGIYGFIVGLLSAWGSTFILFVEEIRDQMNAFVTVLIVVWSTYNIILAIVMLFVIRYLTKQEAKQWFAGSLEDG